MLWRDFVNMEMHANIFILNWTYKSQLKPYRVSHFSNCTCQLRLGSNPKKNLWLGLWIFFLFFPLSFWEMHGNIILLYGSSLCTIRHVVGEINYRKKKKCYHNYHRSLNNISGVILMNSVFPLAHWKWKNIIWISLFFVFLEWINIFLQQWEIDAYFFYTYMHSSMYDGLRLRW